MANLTSLGQWLSGAQNCGSPQPDVARLAERLRIITGIVETLEGCGDEDTLARAAVELARERLGLERCSLYLREGARFHGTYGTDQHGNTMDEQAGVLELAGEMGRFVLETHGGSRIWSKAVDSWTTWQDGKCLKFGEGEVALSVLRTASGPVGLFFNDNAISGAPIDDALQEAVAIYAALLGNLIERQRGAREQENARELFERVFNSVPSSIVIYSSADTLLTANERARRLYNLGELTPLSGLHISALGFAPEETASIIAQNRTLLGAAPDEEVVSDEVSLHVMGRRKTFRRLKFPITMPGSGTRALLSISADITEVQESADRQRRISEGLRKVVIISDELAQIRDRRIFFRRAVEFCLDELGVERCSIFVDEEGYHCGTWGTDVHGRIVDESAYRVPINSEEKAKWHRLVEESGSGYYIHQGDLSQCPNGEVKVVGRGEVAATLIRSHTDVYGIFYNDNLLSGAPIDTATQEVLTVYCSILGNLMARRALEEGRTRSARQYQNLFEQTPTANFICSVDGVIVACNLPFSRLLGFEYQHEGIGQEIRHFLAPRAVVRLMRMVDEHGSLSGEMVEARTIDGEERIVAVHVSTIRGDSRTIIGYQGFLVDTTEQVRVERALEELAGTTVLPGGEGFFPALLESLSRATNIPHIILCETIENRTGWLRVVTERGIGVPAGSEFHCKDIPGELVLKHGEFHMTRGVSERFPECGIAHNLQAQGFYGLALKNSAGWAVGALGLFSTNAMTLTPRTESIIRIFASRAAAEIARTRAEVALRESESRFLQAQKLEALGRFAGSIAHDFNNLLTTILTLSDMAADTLPAGHPVREDITQINRISLKAGNLTRQLLNFGRAHSRGAGSLSVARMIAELKGILERLLGESIRLEIDIAPDTGAIVIDKTRFEQVVVNLAVNARDAMANGGVIRISGSRQEIIDDDPRLAPGMAPGIYSVLKFADTGEGINSEHLSRVFEPFFSTKEYSKGTGLGLFTVYSIVTQNGGNITVQSAPGAGTVFTLVFPHTEFTPAEESSQDEDISLELAGSSHETILLAEDDETVRHSVVGILRRMGYNVLEAPGGGEALLVCERHPGPIHLLLTDVRMPHMNGFELAQRVRRLRPGIRIVYMSGYMDEMESRDRPADAEILAKPFSSKMLNAWIRKALDGEPAAVIADPPQRPE